MFIVALFAIAQNWNNANIHKLANREIVVYSYNEVILTNKRGEKIQLIHTTGNGLKIIIISERSPLPKNSHYMMPFT